MIGSPDMQNKLKKQEPNLIHEGVNKSRNFEDFGNYQAGQWEGDGHCLIPKTKRNSKGNIITRVADHPHFCITLNEMNRPQVKKLQEILGGNLRHKTKEHAQVLTISSFKGLTFLIKQINGKQRTPKEYQFKALIQWMINNNQLEVQSFTYNGLATNCLSNNYWQAGFIDANGYFDINSKAKDRVRFRLVHKAGQRQQINNISYNSIQFQICNEFQQNINNITHHNRIYYEISTSSIKNLINLRDYLIKYPLLTTKRIDLNNWIKAQQLCSNCDSDELKIIEFQDRVADHLTFKDNGEADEKLKVQRGSMNTFCNNRLELLE